MASVLVIDDDRKVRAFVRRVLEAEGHEVREAADGVEGVRAFCRETPDLVLCDLFMPRKGGPATIQEILGRDPDARVLVISGGCASLPADKLPSARRFGAAALLSKPFRPAQLLAAVNAVLAPAYAAR